MTRICLEKVEKWSRWHTFWCGRMIKWKVLDKYKNTKYVCGIHARYYKKHLDKYIVEFASKED